jgi:hypothetical protein
MQEVMIDDYRNGGDYVMVNGTRYGSFSSPYVYLHSGIKSGVPPEGAYALPQRTGIYYASPHGNVPGT